MRQDHRGAARGTTDFTYDAANQLVALVEPGATCPASTDTVSTDTVSTTAGCTRFGVHTGARSATVPGLVRFIALQALHS